MVSELEQQIIKQIEYYFGDINLPRDKFLQEKIKEDDGWVTIEVLLTFKRLAALSTDPEVIAKAVDLSDNKIVEVSEDHKKIRRHSENPVPELTDARKQEIMDRTAYAKGFPLDEDFNKIISFLDEYGPVESCMRRSTKDHKFKGSCFIIFKDLETCKKFVEMESIKYGETELIRKFQKVYFEEEKEARKKAKDEKKAASANNGKPEKQIEFPKGAVVHISGFQEGHSVNREELREKVKEVSEMDIQYVDFNRGDMEGYLLFPEENNAVEFNKKITDGELVIGENKIKIKVLEGEEEEEYLKKRSDAIHQIRKQRKQNSMHKKRKGNFGHGGRESKSKRSE